MMSRIAASRECLKMAQTVLPPTKWTDGSWRATDREWQMDEAKGRFPQTEATRFDGWARAMASDPMNRSSTGSEH